MSSFNEKLQFEWDEGNTQKNLLKHNVDQDDIEEAFYNLNIILFDKKHLKGEVRFRLMGRTNEQRILIIVFTMRNQQVRVISARDANKKERINYENYKKT